MSFAGGLARNSDDRVEILEHTIEHEHEARQFLRDSKFCVALINFSCFQIDTKDALDQFTLFEY